MSVHKKLHSFTGTSDHDFTGLVSGQLIQYNGSGIVSAGAVPTSGSLWSASTGSNSIIANNGTGNLAAADSSIVGGKYNTITSDGYASTIAGGQNNIVSQYRSFIGAGQFNTASGKYSVVTGGYKNASSGLYSSVVVGGGENSATTNYSAVVGGSGNTVSGAYSIIGGGQNNSASGNWSFIGGGVSNTATGSTNFIGGGFLNRATGLLSFVGGGQFNSATTANNSAVVSGRENLASANYSMVVGGFQNTASGRYSSVVNGLQNVASGQLSSVLGGRSNVASGQGSSVLAGTGNTVSGNLSAIAGGSGMTNSFNNTFMTMNARLAENNGVIYSAGTDLYNIFLTSATSDVTRVQPGANITTGGTGNLPTVSLVASPSVNNITFSGSAIGGNVQAAVVTATSLSATTLSGGTILSGSTNLYDIFSSTSANLWSASTGTNSIIANNGSGNLASGYYSFAGGQNNSATTIHSISVGGKSNLAEGNYSVIVGGSYNTTLQTASFIGAGGNNLASAQNSVVVGGSTNTSSGNNSAIVGGFQNLASAQNSFVGGGYGNSATTTYSFVGGGYKNLASGNYSSVVGGRNNTASGAHSMAAGSGNTVSGTNSAVLGGSGMTNSFNDTLMTMNARLAQNGGVIYSAGTDLYNIFLTSATSDVTRVQPGANITTGGTGNLPTVSLVASPSVNGLSISGTANVTGVLQSGGTDLNTIYVQGTGTVGTLPLWTGSKTITNSLISQTGTGVTVNGSVQIYGNVDILGTATTFNTQTVSTSDNNITMNLSGSHVSALYGGITVLSGTPNNVSSTWTIDANGAWSANTGIITSAVTVSGGNIAVSGGGAFTSGGTDLYSIFSTTDTNDITRVQPGANITTGGTANNPIVSLAASPSVNNITFSGSAIGGSVQAGAGTFTSLSATTLSGGTILSGSTNLYSIFATTGSGISGSGTDNTVPLWNGSTALDNSILTQQGTSAMTMSGSLVVTGNFTVNGTTTTINTTTLQAKDNNIELNYSGNNTSANGGGITILSGVSNATNATWLIDSVGNWASNAGIQGTTVTATEFFSMAPYTGANPSSPANNNAWFHSGTTGTITLNYRVGGVNYSVELA